MHSYIYLALLSPMLWAVVNIIDDYQIKKIYRTSSLAVIMTGFFLFVPLLYSLTQGVSFSFYSALFGVGAGIAVVSANWFYFKALAKEDTAVVIALWSLAPVVIFVLSTLFLGETLNQKQMVGSGIIILSTFLISFFGKSIFRFSSALLVMLVATILYAIGSVVEKHTYNIANDFYSALFFITLGMLIGTSFFLFSKANIQDTFNIIFKKKRFLAFIIVSEVINTAAIATQNYAISLGEVTLVKVIEALQPIFVLLFMVLLSFFVPFYKKTLDYQTLLPKILLMACTVFGFTLLY